MMLFLVRKEIEMASDRPWEEAVLLFDFMKAEVRFAAPNAPLVGEGVEKRPDLAFLLPLSRMRIFVQHHYSSFLERTNLSARRF